MVDLAVDVAFRELFEAGGLLDRLLERKAVELLQHLDEFFNWGFIGG